PTSASASVGAVILAKRVTLEENLFFGVGPGIGVRVYTARGAQPASAVGNVFATVQFSPEVANFLGPFGEPHTRTFAADWPSPAANNRAVRELSQVLVDPNFADWHSAPTVKLDLPSNAYCSITNHVPNAQTTPKDDFLRRPRTGSTVSAGAFQFQGTSCSSP
ncbi:MAG TPA: hypothetical protein PK141_28595, partial [Polyangiaceae bacterium]|nr:hypothetical protein [Polyangiaceae bacterium]